LCRCIIWEGSLLSNFSTLTVELEAVSETLVHLKDLTLLKGECILLNSVAALQDM